MPTNEKNRTQNGLTLSCNANQQTGGAGKPPLRAELSLVKQSDDDVLMHVEHLGYSYDVDWNIKLTALYMTIKKADRTGGWATSTARVPSKDHNDSMLDVTFPDPLLRLYLTCDFVEYRP